jgi:hypothetical protein
MMWTKQSVAELARENVIRVTFTKSDGTERVMVCSLMDQYLPPIMEDAETITKDNQNVLAVMDLQARSWRSFRINSIIKVETME